MTTMAVEEKNVVFVLCFIRVEPHPCCLFQAFVCNTRGSPTRAGWPHQPFDDSLEVKKVMTLNMVYSYKITGPRSLHTSPAFDISPSGTIV